MRSDFAQYDPEYISGVMSLRKPQKHSLEILDEICQSVQLRKNGNLRAALGAVHALYPTCTDFEREFVSITFALATGVGKTRLMGAFIAYLYTNHGIRNFFVVAPNTTIYDKLKKDLGDFNSEKYVFRGLGCFSSPPQVVTETDYKEKAINFLTSDIRLFIYNIDKFNKENAEMRREHERLGGSFLQLISGLKDLVLIMDESHHYRADRGSASLNELRPLLGLELTATPVVTSGKKQTLFKNVVYEYPLSSAIADGYTRTPFAVTRSDIKHFHFGDDELDRLMLQDGLLCHERAKQSLAAYVANHPTEKKVKPFMLVVCKDTDHAKQVEAYIRSALFGNGEYASAEKTIVVHSKQKSTESEANMKLLLDVEKYDNPVEIVIHVNMLKEGWDVNNLYTIVPLRTAASKVLREQMVGRGLRLPYGFRTGDKDVDAVMLTAHDKFDEILNEAQSGDSIFKAGNIIKAEELQPKKNSATQLTMELGLDSTVEKAYKKTGIRRNEQATKLIKEAERRIARKVAGAVSSSAKPLTKEEAEKIVKDVSHELGEDRDLGTVFNEFSLPLAAWLHEQVEETQQTIFEKFIPIPRIRITDEGVEEYRFVDFDLEMDDFNHAPIANDILIQNLEDMSDRERVRMGLIDFDGYRPEKEILSVLRAKPEIDYEKCSALLYKLITAVCHHYEAQYGENGLRNIVMMYKRDIADHIYTQMMKHFYCENGFLVEEVIGVSTTNMVNHYTYTTQQDLFQNYAGDIHGILFEGIRYGVFSSAKFDSRPELIFARVLERDAKHGTVKNWLRPAALQFNITYNRGRHYQPDFVVETADKYYLVEIKGEDKLNDPDVIAKKGRAIQYCKTASAWCKANGYKEWRYLFIPSAQVTESSTFDNLVKQFETL